MAGHLPSMLRLAAAAGLLVVAAGLLWSYRETQPKPPGTAAQPVSIPPPPRTPAAAGQYRVGAELLAAAAQPGDAHDQWIAALRSQLPTSPAPLRLAVSFDPGLPPGAYFLAESRESKQLAHRLHQALGPQLGWRRPPRALRVPWLWSSRDPGVVLALGQQPPDAAQVAKAVKTALQQDAAATSPGRPQRPRIAIVIDDLGNATAGTEEMTALDFPLTFAVMPALRSSGADAELAFGRGHEVILHMPMEPLSMRPEWAGPGMILAGDSGAAVRERLLKALRSVPHAIGFNNHMGSRATADEGIARAAVAVALEQHLLVLDSLTSNRSRLGPVAVEQGLPAAVRSVFLDNVKTADYVKQQLRLLASVAREQGSAIGIGHVGSGGKQTAAALAEMLPQLAAEGFEIVFLSDLAEPAVVPKQ